MPGAWCATLLELNRRLVLLLHSEHRHWETSSRVIHTNEQQVAWLTLNRFIVWTKADDLWHSKALTHLHVWTLPRVQCHVRGENMQPNISVSFIRLNVSRKQWKHDKHLFDHDKGDKLKQFQFQQKQTGQVSRYSVQQKVNIRQQWSKLRDRQGLETIQERSFACL